MRGEMHGETGGGRAAEWGPERAQNRG